MIPSRCAGRPCSASASPWSPCRTCCAIWRAARSFALCQPWYADAGPISLYYAGRELLPAKTRVFVDFVAEAFARDRLPSASREFWDRAAIDL